MKHYGDITKINGAEVPVVDIVTGGSPCQDLSVAGKRAGLNGERSGLFMEQIRVIKEMRRKDQENGRTNERIRPRYMVWENVPGALSSGDPKGEDFRIVLEETARVVQEDAVVPRPAKWSNSGAVVGNGWSIAWRIHDAQFWGVPQRRKRIALVADFGGYSAPEILFERKSVFGDSEPGGEKREAAATGTEGGIGEAGSYTPKIRGGCEVDSSGKKAGKGPLVQTEKAGTISAAQDQTLIKTFGIGSFNSEGMKSENPSAGISEADTSRTLDNNGGNPACWQGGTAVVQAVDCRHGTESDVGGALQSSCKKNVNSNNVVRIQR